MRIKLNSYYDHFPNHKPVDNEPYVEMYNDEFVWQSQKDSCVLLIEPRSIIPVVYKYVEQNWKKFKYIFTHRLKIRWKGRNICEGVRSIKTVMAAFMPVISEGGFRVIRRTGCAGLL